MSEAVVIPLTSGDDSSASAAVAFGAGSAAAEASIAREDAAEAQALATDAAVESAATAAEVDGLGNDLLALMNRVSSVELMMSELTGTLLDAINAADAAEAEGTAEAAITPVIDEPPPDATEEDEPEEEAPTEEAPEPVKEEKKHATRTKRYGFRH